MRTDSWLGGACRAVIVLFAGGACTFGLSATPACGSDSCGCDDIRAYPGYAATTVHQPLECLCSSGSSDCRQDESDYERYLCGGADAGVTLGTVVRWTGCGRVTLGAEGGFGGRALTFDAKTGALVGIEDSSDTIFGACNTGSYAYGTTFDDCDNNERCTLCGAGTARTCP